MPASELIGRYIRHHETHLFLTEDGKWTSDLAQAKSWPSLSMMHELCARFGLTNVDVVLKFNGEQYDCVLPLNC